MLRQSSAQTRSPGQLRRGHEGIEPRLIQVPPEYRGDGTQQVRGPRGGDRQQNRLQGQQEPLGALLAVLVGRKQGLELRTQVL